MDPNAIGEAMLGWTTLDLFSVYPAAGAIRVDYCGGLILASEPITAVTAQHMKWKNATRVRELPGRPNEGVPVGLFGRTLAGRDLLKALGAKEIA